MYNPRLLYYSLSTCNNTQGVSNVANQRTNSNFTHSLVLLFHSVLHFTFNSLFTHQCQLSILKFPFLLFNFSNPLVCGVLFSSITVKFSQRFKIKNIQKSKVSLVWTLLYQLRLSVKFTFQSKIQAERFSLTILFILDQLCFASNINHIKPLRAEFPQCGLTSSYQGYTVQSLLPPSHRHAQIQPAITQGSKITPTTR